VAPTLTPLEITMRKAATIEVTGLRKRFGTAVALDGLSFTMLPGRVTGFFGPNGAGKSTTMRVISAWTPLMQAARWSAGSPTGACGTR
jgi:ABC-type sugar transport system ATPase subunit